MTRTEAYDLLLALPKSGCYVSQSVIKHEDLATMNEIDNFDYDKLLAYFQNLDLPYEFILKFITDELDGYADLDNNTFGDEYDYLELWRRDDGKLDLGVWTETAGKMYFLSEYGKTWKEYTLSEDEMNAREERSKYWSEKMKDIYKDVAAAFPKLMAELKENK